LLPSFLDFDLQIKTPHRQVGSSPEPLAPSDVSTRLPSPVERPADRAGRRRGIRPSVAF